MRVPTTEHCEICANETPKEIIAKSGRARVRVFQDLDSGSYVCERGHEVDLSPAMPEVAEGLSERRPTPPAAQQPMPAKESSVAVAELPSRAEIVPGSGEIQRDGTLAVKLIVPEQYVGPLQSYCEGIGKSVEEFINEVVAGGFENGWFLVRGSLEGGSCLAVQAHPDKPHLK